MLDWLASLYDLHAIILYLCTNLVFYDSAQLVTKPLQCPHQKAYKTKKFRDSLARSPAFFSNGSSLVSSGRVTSVSLLLRHHKSLHAIASKATAASSTIIIITPATPTKPQSAPLDFPTQKESGIGGIGFGNTVNINFCSSCSYRFWLSFYIWIYYVEMAAKRGGRCWFAVESKSYEITTEVAEERIKGIIVERSRGFTSWIRFGSFSLRCLLEGVEACWQGRKRCLGMVGFVGRKTSLSGIASWEESKGTAAFYGKGCTDGEFVRKDKKSYVEAVNSRGKKLGEAVWLQLGEDEVSNERKFLGRCLVGRWDNPQCWNQICKLSKVGGDLCGILKVG
ncbi:hypothetical protein CK203_061766 [Vitis vinifera]|uniref:Uncharacterized protein n=1 Tax=Vitis vinifera TaxID=29760 RepID=A0A438GSN1_VITVI|nr:hypothetical protein CK203_061766 [Vitis vinifera]